MNNKTKNTETIWFTSDTHYYHKNIIRYSNRPFQNIIEMNEALINNWNSRVRPNDTVYHLGDVAFCDYSKLEKILKRLNGNIHIILGNHDKVIIQNKDKLLADGIVQSIQDYKTIKHDGKFVVLFHYSGRIWDGSHRGSYMLFGHSHGSLPPYGRSFDVGVDSKVITSEYRPISIKEVINYMEKIDVPTLARQ